MKAIVAKKYAINEKTRSNKQLKTTIDQFSPEIEFLAALTAQLTGLKKEIICYLSFAYIRTSVCSLGSLFLKKKYVSCTISGVSGVF